MERVQFQQEQMLDELKDLVEKHLFTEKETKQIVKKRTAFETALVRRVAKKADFLRYAAYEMGLEQLRRKRVERTKSENTIPSLSDYALVRRQFQIFERALKKFKSDVGLWIQYIYVAQREGARALVGRITAKALQLHPNRPALYILAAAHELNHQSPSSARTLLQRGIRLNNESIELWREYVKMELGFIESLRRRWDVLGINQSPDQTREGGQVNIADDPSRHIVPGLVETPPNQEPMDEDVEGADSRKEIMQGAIVRSVMASAAQALPKIELFETLKTLLTEYPSPPSLREALLEHLYILVRETLPDHAGAIKLLADRFLTPDLKGEDLVDGLRQANEELVRRAEEGAQEEILQVYAAFVEEWCGAPIDANMKQYLISTLRMLSQKGHARGSPSLLSAHIRLLTKTEASGAAKVLRTARKYTNQAPKSASVWLARLDAEERFGEGQSCVDGVWREARAAVEGSTEEIEGLWRWGLRGKDAAEARLIHEELLKESMRIGSVGGLHASLLMSYVGVMHEVHREPVPGQTSEQGSYSARWLASVRHMASAYVTTGEVWQLVFRTMAEDGTEWEGKEKVLGEVYGQWQCKNEIEATLEWGKWLLGAGQAQAAAEAVAGCARRLGESERRELEKRWMGMLMSGSGP